MRVVLLLIMLAIILVPFFSCIHSLSNNISTVEFSGPSAVDAWVEAQYFVKDRLKAPASAKFPWVDTDDIVTNLGGGRYQVTAYVDSQNGFGAMLRSHFTCVVKYEGKENWICESLHFRP